MSSPEPPARSRAAAPAWALTPATSICTPRMTATPRATAAAVSAARTGLEARLRREHRAQAGLEAGGCQPGRRRPDPVRRRRSARRTRRRSAWSEGMAFEPLDQRSEAGRVVTRAPSRTCTSSTIRPSATTRTRSACTATRALWVTRTVVWDCSRQSRLSSSITSWPLWRSRLPVGSSASSRVGAAARARARATRCCSPPEISSGPCPWRPCRESWSISTLTRSATARRSGRVGPPRRDPPRSRSGRATFSAAVRLGIRLKNWKTKPM